MPKKETFLQRAERSFQSNANARRNTAKSLKWFRQFMKQFKTASRPELLKAEEFDERKRIVSGGMYMYRYDAKTKATLPYWDAFPLIFAVEPAKGGFYGLNLHYLSPTQRARFFDRLMDITTNSRMDKTTRIAVSYRLLKQIQKFRAFEPCFKRYLYSHLKSPMMKVPSQHWESVLFMPSQQFKKASPTKVWRDSYRMIR